MHCTLTVRNSAMVELAAAGAPVGAEDVARPPSTSSTKNPEPTEGSSAPAQVGSGSESQSPYTGAPGRTGSAGTAQGVPSRDPTASRGKKKDAPIDGSGSRSGEGARGQGTDSAGSLTGQSVGESIGKSVPEQPTQRR